MKKDKIKKIKYSKTLNVVEIQLHDIANSIYARPEQVSFCFGNVLKIINFKGDKEVIARNLSCKDLNILRTHFALKRNCA